MLQDRIWHSIFTETFLLGQTFKTSQNHLNIKHGVQGKMISVDNFFRIFEIIIFCFVVAISDLVHAVEATYGLS